MKPGRRETTSSYYPHTCYGADRRGGVAGAKPPHKGGPNRPDRTTAVVSGQWSVVSGQWSVVSVALGVCLSGPERNAGEPWGTHWE